jgi:hypothetical protein
MSTPSATATQRGPGAVPQPLGHAAGVEQRLGVGELQIKADHAAHQVEVGQQHPLRGGRRSAKAVCAASVDAPEPGLALEKATMEPGSACSTGSGLQQPVQAGHCVVLRLHVERRVQKLARAAPQRAQNRIRIVAHMQPHHVRPQVERGHAANQLAGLIEVRRQVEQDDVRLGLTHPDFQRLLRG